MPGDDTRLSIVLFIESAIGLLNLQHICERANTICLQSKVVKVDGLVFGSDDFCADIGTSLDLFSTDYFNSLHAG